MNISDFVSEVQQIHSTGSATEHSYRSALQSLFSSIDKDVVALNEPKRVKCGAPDFLINRGEIVIGHVEAKDIDKNLSTLKGTEADQKRRYLKALPNLVYTNCLDFEFYREGELISQISIADFMLGILPKPDQYASLEHQLTDFAAQRPQTITSSEKLAVIMAGKAVLIKDVLFNTLKEDKDFQTDLAGQYKAFQEHLIHDLEFEDFADVYAETIAYGMFAARLHDDTLENFSRQEALELLPKSNPFLRAIFGYIAGHDLDDRIKWIIDDLADVFQAADVKKIMENFGALTGRNDPFLHFYETFLAKYNPAKRKSRGVWYTPEPVVNFIVRAVDDVLKTEFSLPMGLADTSKVTINWDTGEKERTKAGKMAKSGQNAVVKKEVHRVQILDPATGTGTFLGEVIKQISPRVQDIAPGQWNGYVEKELIPRLHGFEILMASYAMCHMKLDMILTELDYQPTKVPPRLSVYLTNSLEEGEADKQALLFAQWLSNEAKHANAVKRDMPIMCVIGNPPYSGISQNMGNWITELIEDYKYVNGVHFAERKHWLHDDYVKFIRLSESLIEKNGEGVLGFITNHGYLDNLTFRGMRWHLLKTFNKIYVLDLHGNRNKKETTPDGRRDKNVFDIQQGVAIIIAVKKRDETEGLAEVRHADLWGSRKVKYSALNGGTLSKLITEKIECHKPQYAFAPRNHDLEEQYAEGFGVTEFFPANVTGIVTMGDGFALAKDADSLRQNLDDLLNHKHTEESLKRRYKLGKNYAKWIIGNKAKLANTDLHPVPIVYRPFDNKVTFFDNRILWRWREKVMKHMLSNGNYALIFSRQAVHSDAPPVNVLVSKHIFDNRGVYSNKGISQAAPLYLFPDEQDLNQIRRVNFDTKLYKKLQKQVKISKHGTPDEVQVFDYIYGVLHCPTYREFYAEYLKIDFPRIPWPSSPDEFWSVSEKGTALRKLHLLEPAAIGQTPYTFNGNGDNVVDKPIFKSSKVWINKTQYFADVPDVSWSFYIGGYQPAQKWLKDRKSRQLSFDDIVHYQKIIKILAETDRIMRTIELDLGD